MIAEVTICVCDGLQEGVEYYFRVRAVNAIGHGDALTSPLPVAPKDPPKVPLPPNNLEAIKITPNSATLIFEPPFNDGGSLITHYVLESKAVNKVRREKVILQVIIHCTWLYSQSYLAMYMHNGNSSLYIFITDLCSFSGFYDTAEPAHSRLQGYKEHCLLM